jgi:hypothetical protein
MKFGITKETKLKKIILLVLILSIPILAQQVNYTWGVKADGSAYDGAGLVYIDTTRNTTNDIYVDISDYYPFEPNPYMVSYTGASSDTVGLDSLYYAEFNNSSRATFGTFFCSFDNQGTANPTTDSVLFTIKVYPGVYTTASKSLAGVYWGSAVTLETVERINDYFSINNVYVHSTKYKTFPPEVLKFEIAPIGRSGADDSTSVAWRYAYPAIYHVHEVQKPE